MTLNGYFPILGTRINLETCTGHQEASSSFSAESRNRVSSGLTPGPPARWPQIDGIVLSSALGIWATSSSLSSGGKYRSVLHGMTIALALIAPKAFLKIAAIDRVGADVALLPGPEHCQQVR